MKRAVQIFRLWLNKVFVPVAKFVSFFKRPETIICENDVEMIRDLIEDGDALFSRTEWELSNFGLPGFYKHAAIYLNGRVYQAITKGVSSCSLDAFMYKKDGVALARVPGPEWTQDQILSMLIFVREQLGEAYDYSFSWDTFSSWYCSKLVMFAYKTAKPESVDAIKTMTVLGEKTLSPQDMFESMEYVAKVGLKK